jgi:hypothetical protein
MNKNLAITFVFHIRLLPFVDERDKGYIFSFGDVGINIAAYVSGRSELVYEAKKAEDGKPFQILYPCRSLLNNFVVLTFRLKNLGKLFLEILVNEQSVETISHDPLALDSRSSESFFVLGANFDKRFPGVFDLAEQVVYSRILIAEEHSRLIDYFKNRRGEAAIRHVHFGGNAFLVRDPSTGHLTQETKANQPTHVNK